MYWGVGRKTLDIRQCSRVCFMVTPWRYFIGGDGEGMEVEGGLGVRLVVSP